VVRIPMAAPTASTRIVQTTDETPKPFQPRLPAAP
jgi:hypothetical protein